MTVDSQNNIFLALLAKHKRTTHPCLWWFHRFQFIIFVSNQSKLN